ncbi:dual specificity protein phosphatase 15 isoform X2 [Castor canadensis]
MYQLHPLLPCQWGELPCALAFVAGVVGTSGWEMGPLNRLSFAGISRSTTIVTAYVMTVTGLGWREVLEAIKATRPIANPNPGFRQQLEEFGWGNSRKIRRQLEERFGESPFRDEEDLRALLPLCKRCRQGSVTSAASSASHATASEGTLQRLVPRAPRDAHRPLPLLARVKQTFSCLPRCLSRKGSK